MFFSHDWSNSCHIHAHPSILKIQSQDLSIGCPAATIETKSVVLLRKIEKHVVTCPCPLQNVSACGDKWEGLEMGYSPNYSRLNGNMRINID